MKLVVCLGNIGDEYKNNRHNTGFIVGSLVEKRLADKMKIKFLYPDKMMNNSGRVVMPLVKTPKDLKNLIVIYDDMDLPLGKMRVSFNRSAGGHNGLGSIIKALKSEEFVRIRIGVSPHTPTVKFKKPTGEQKVLDFLLSDFKKPELEELKKLSKKVSEAVETIFTEGKDKAMSLYN